MRRTCPTEEQLLPIVLDDAAVTNWVARHTSTCPGCQARLARLRQEVASIRRGASTRPGEGTHLDELAMADFVDGLLPSEDRARSIAHLATCGRCRRDLAALIALMSDEEIAAETGTTELRPSVRRRRWAMSLGAVAATLLLTFILLPHHSELPSLGHRGPTFTASQAPSPIGPLGDVDSAATLVWGGVAGAGRYRVTLFTTDGRALLYVETADTAVAIPDSVRVKHGTSYLWKVEVEVDRDRWTSSDLMEFRIRERRHSDLRPLRGPDSLAALAQHLPDSALVNEVRHRPTEVRDALGVLLDAAARGTTAARDQNVAAARRLARAWAAAWHDDFLNREVERFASWPVNRALAKVRADSLRRAGTAAYGKQGPTAAVAIWRRALAGSTAVVDTAGMAAVLGNIGAALARSGADDSAEAYLSRARTLAAAIGDIRVEANATGELAGVNEGRDPAAAIRDYRKAAALRARIGDSRGLAADYNNLAGMARQSGDLDEAERYLDSALTLNRREGRPEDAATNLVNLAAIAILEGDFSRAEALYSTALATWREREQWADVADAERGLGELGIRRGDYPAARGHLLVALGLYVRTGLKGDAVAVRQILATVLAGQGDLQGALEQLRTAQGLADSAHLGADVRAGVLLARADLADQLNRYDEAERLYAAAEAMARGTADAAGEAAARFGRARVLLGRDDLGGAARLLEQAIAAQTTAGDRRSAALTRLWLGEVDLRKGDTADARAQVVQASSELGRLGDPVAQAAAFSARGDLEARAGFPASAESLYRQGLAIVGTRTVPDVSWHLRAGLGVVLEHRGAVDGAAVAFRGAIHDIEQAGRTIVVPERRSTYLADKWDVYVRLATLERTRGRVDSAFALSERLRAGELRDLLAQGRVASPDATTPELAAREQDLRRYIGDLWSELEAGGEQPATVRGPDVSRASSVSREALVRAQSAYADLLLEMRDRAPRHTDLVAPPPVGWRDVAARLSSDQAFIEYLLGDEGVIAFVLTRDTLVALPLSVGREDLARTVDFARATLAPRRRGGLDSLWRAPLRRLHQDLMAPIESSGLLAGKKRLIIVPHAELHYLPFAALLDGAANRYLIERYQVLVTPSASVWLALGGRRPTRETRGVLALAPRPEALPASRAEMNAVAGLGAADVHVVVGDEATEALFRREAPTRRVIHLATYGVLNRQNPLFSYVELASSGTGSALEVHDVFGLDLSADLVVLSACQSGLASGALGDVPAGDDWIGLTQAFLSAGAARVIATLWPVQDQASATLMQRFYGEYHIGDDAGRALADAQRALLSAPATANPYYWAGFQLVGGS